MDFYCFTFSEKIWTELIKFIIIIIIIITFL
jgi:hypothetical protein